MADLFGGGIPEDVTYADENTGDSLAINLSDDDANAATWTLDVYAQQKEGRYFVGRIVTTTAVARTALGLPNARCVACVSMPNTRRWYVTARSTGGAIQHAEIMLTSSKQGSGAFGLTPVSP